MRGTRWLLLVAIAAIVAGVAYKYRQTRLAIQAQSPEKPAPLSIELSGTAQDWHISEDDHKTGRKKFDIRAKSMATLADSSRVDLKGVTMKIYAKDGKTYDLVTSAAATFDTNTRNLFSGGETEITVGLPIDGPPPPDHMPTVIKTSGVSFDSNTNRSDTDAPSTFVFAKGEGKATGATYDPNEHTLQMKHAVEITWRPPKPGAKPMKIESDGLSYHEAKNEIWLTPWGRLTRENTVVQGDQVVVSIQDKKVIHHVTALNAHGNNEYPTRKLRYNASELAIDFDEDGIARKVIADGNVELLSTSATTETTVIADHVDMDLDTDSGESVLTHATGRGHAVVNSKPLPAPERQLSESHVLRSETFDIKMRSGGREIESLVTGNVPGQLEFLPNTPAQRHRTLDGRDFAILYGAQNRVENFRAKDVKTTTEPNADDKKRNRSISTTTSRDLEARFNPRTSQLSNMQQTGDFVYEEGDRHARAARATLDSDQSVIVLDTGANVSDAMGSTKADRIRLDQRSGDFMADGNVTSSRLPDRDPKKNSEMLSGDEPLQATARKMESKNRNRTIHYEGAVNMWQGANRIRADVVDIDRSGEKRTLVADGHVITDLWEAPKDEKKKASTTPVLTEVRAGHMVYTESDRLTHYTGGVQLNRPNMRVKSKELRAYLAEQSADSDSRVDKAVADGTVEIFSTAKDRTRTGTGEHAEYFTADQKVILNGGWVKMVEKKFVEPKPTVNEGTELTYYAGDNRLETVGAPGKPGNTRVTKTSKKK
ncbi:MAG TPA: LPS export ABC transporter periplasmic protein LptC [Candidatus Solibacter sp.]|nr:LPS export ABC transporter periplasmic protein LptC [Candidatus Solibacter sp.]